jgi:UPF0755 protein
MRRFVLVLILLLVAAGAFGYLYLQRQFDRVHTPPSLPAIVEIPSGLGTRGVIQLLHERGILPDPQVALAYAVWSGARQKLRAGEYRFDRPMTTAEVLDKLVRGSIYLHRFTVPEGLTVAETALRWEEQGFGPAADFETAARASVELIRDLDPKARSLEGYLFPETYFFAARTPPQQAVKSMVSRFRLMLRKLQGNIPAEQWPVEARELVILASIIETEAAHNDERPLVGSVYVNRIKKRMLLQCDPTVVYALKQHGKYRGRLTTADLRFDSPFNTYKYPGLPPGPIASPGFRSLEAAARPAVTTHLFFVRAEGGRHTFTDTLAAHNRAVTRYRDMVRRQARLQK